MLFTDTDPEISTTPSPMMVGGQEVGGLSYTPATNPYVLRFSPIDDEGNQLYSMDSILEDLFVDRYETWAISEETKPKLHYHIYLESEKTLDDLKKHVRDFIYPYYPVRKRGFGTKQYSCLQSEKPLNAIVYLLKQRGEYHFSGFEQKFIDSCLKISFEKSANEFEKEVADLSQEFLKSKMDPYEYAEKLCIIYSQYDKRIHFKDIQGLVNSKIIKRDPSKAASMCHKQLAF